MSTVELTGESLDKFQGAMGEEIEFSAEGSEAGTFPSTSILGSYIVFG